MLCLYQPRCTVVFDAQQKHNISSFWNFANRFLKKIAFFSKNSTFSAIFREKCGFSPSRQDKKSGVHHDFNRQNQAPGKRITMYNSAGTSPRLAKICSTSAWKAITSPALSCALFSPALTSTLPERMVKYSSVPGV